MAKSDKSATKAISSSTETIEVTQLPKEVIDLISKHFPQLQLDGKEGALWCGIFCDGCKARC